MLVNKWDKDLFSRGTSERKQMTNGISHKLYHMIEMRTTTVAGEESKEDKELYHAEDPGVDSNNLVLKSGSPTERVTFEQKFEGGEGLSYGGGVL